jgi:hypothetical protein
MNSFSKRMMPRLIAFSDSDLFAFGMVLNVQFFKLGRFCRVVRRTQTAFPPRKTKYPNFECEGCRLSIESIHYFGGINTQVTEPFWRLRREEPDSHQDL